MAANRVLLLSKDGKVFPVDVKVAKVSQLLRTVFDNYGLEPHERVQIPYVRGEVLELILKWATRYQDNFDVHQVELSDWEKELLDLPLPKLLEVVKAAHYLYIPRLVIICCKTMLNDFLLETPKTSTSQAD